MAFIIHIIVLYEDSFTYCLPPPVCNTSTALIAELLPLRVCMFIYICANDRILHWFNALNMLNSSSRERVKMKLQETK